MSDLIRRLREEIHSYDEWRVQDPKDGAYCIAYSWPETMQPEREARAWLADHKARFPDSMYAGYEVACVRVLPHKDRLLQEAADRIEADEALLRQALEAFDSMYGRKPERVEKVVAAIRARLEGKA